MRFDSGIEAILIRLIGTSDDVESDKFFISSKISRGEVGSRKKLLAVGSGTKLEKCCPRYSMLSLRFFPTGVCNARFVCLDLKHRHHFSVGPVAGNWGALPLLRTICQAKPIICLILRGKARTLMYLIYSTNEFSSSVVNIVGFPLDLLCLPKSLSESVFLGIPNSRAAVAIFHLSSTTAAIALSSCSEEYRQCFFEGFDGA